MAFTPAHTGFPSPAADFIEQRLDLNQHLIAHPAATFFFRTPAHDLLIVDRSLTPKRNSIVIAVVDGELVETQLRNDMEIWGVVTYMIRCMK